MDPMIDLKPRERDLSSGFLKEQRKNKVIPASIYGKEVSSQPVWLHLREVPFRSLEMGQMFLTNWEDQTYRLKMDQIQRDPVSRDLLHVSFHAVTEFEEIEMEVPVRITGEARGVVNDKCVIVPVLETVRLKGRPDNIPREFIVDVTNLEMNENMTVKNLTIPEGTELIQTDLDEVLVTCKPPQSSGGGTEEAPMEGFVEEISP